MLKRFIAEDSGMEMVEWAIVGVVFAISGAAAWTTLGGTVNGALGNIGAVVSGNGGN